MKNLRKRLAAGQGPGAPRTDRDPAGCGTTTVVYWAPGPSRVSHPQPVRSGSSPLPDTPGPGTWATCAVPARPPNDPG